MSNQELIKRPQSREAQLDGGAAQMMPTQKPQISAEIVPLQFLPSRSLFPFLVVPAMKLLQRLAIIALGVNRRAAVGGQVLEKAGQPGIGDRLFQLRGTGFIR